jgi:outer membrane protein OmpA-like peptidoglycan-associated protein
VTILLINKTKFISSDYPITLKRFGLASLILSNFLTPVASANVVGSDTQNFNPTTSGLDFVTVQSSETLNPGHFNFGLFINQAVNSLPYFDDTEQGRTTYTDSVVGADLNIGIGLLPNLDIGLSLPQLLHQEVESDGFRGQFSNNGNTEIRVNSKFRFYGNDSGGAAFIASGNQNRIENNPFVGIDAGPTYNLELALDTTVSNFALALNVGHRWRQPGTKIDEASPIEPLGDQYLASAAASFLIPYSDTKLIAEIFSSIPSEDETEASERLASSAETLFGIKHAYNQNVALHLGTGTELVNGRSSPDWRVYAGLNVSTGPKPKPRLIAPEPTPESIEDPFSGPALKEEKIVIHDILFEFDSAKVSESNISPTLEKLVAHLKKSKGYTKLIIEGHTDSIGTQVYNLGLSKRRAETIRLFLIKKFSLSPDTIEARGRGEDLPIADNGNFQGRQLNRRVEFAIFRDL